MGWEIRSGEIDRTSRLNELIKNCIFTMDTKEVGKWKFLRPKIYQFLAYQTVQVLSIKILNKKYIINS